MKKINPLKLLVAPKKEAQTEKKIGHIIVPGTIRHKKVLTEGLVVECGKGTPDIPMEVKVGDRIKFHNFDGRLKVGENILLDKEDILLILD